MKSNTECRVAVVIPSFRVKKHILFVIQDIGPEVTSIYVIDDKCPDASGSRLQVPSVVRASVRVAPGVSRKDTNAHVSWTCQLDHTCMRPFSSPVMMSPVSSE